MLLNGDLGAGKTLLAQGIVKGLGATDAVTSPTYALVNVYHGRCEIYHFDLFRLNNYRELADIGFFEMVEGNGVTIIEWAEKFATEMPENPITITLERLSERAGRRLIIEANSVDISD